MHCQVWFPKGTCHYFTQKQQRIFSTAWFTLPQNKKTYLTSGINYVQVQTIQGNVCLQSSQPICIPYSGDGDSGIGSKPHYPICGTNPQEFGYMYVIYINNYKYIFIFIYILDKFIYIYIITLITMTINLRCYHFFVTRPYNTIPRDQNKGDKRARSMSFAGARRTIEVVHMQGPELCKILGVL